MATTALNKAPIGNLVGSVLLHALQAHVTHSLRIGVGRMPTAHGQEVTRRTPS